MIYQAAPGAVAQLFEIKSGPLGKGPHLVNVLRQPGPRADDKRRMSFSLDPRQLTVRHPLQLKPRALVANLLHKGHRPQVRTHTCVRVITANTSRAAEALAKACKLKRRKHAGHIDVSEN